MVFFNFWNFFAIFVEFSITRRVGSDQNGIFIFSLSRPSPTYFGLKRSHNSIFFNFLNFFAIFFKFSITRRVGTNRNDNFYFLSFMAFSNLFWPEKKP